MFMVGRATGISFRPRCVVPRRLQECRLTSEPVVLVGKSVGILHGFLSAGAWGKRSGASATPCFHQAGRNIIDEPRNDDRVSELFLSFEGGDVVDHGFAGVGDRQIVEGAGLNAHMRASKSGK
jgi:hypothetical protein